MTGLVRFERPVVIQIGRYTERTVFDVNDAASILLRDLGGRQTEKHRAAMDACLKVIRGELHPPAARRAFVAVAREAKILRCD
ncbi:MULTISPECIES: DUF982 domain-containing protein [unclassified Mesorhizobium]|uniref:DUF982 domain-containing protein n=1 Tax=unclassified Mesorhizobium TaxID=325217 RepID=UPI0003CE2935|nr:DUF982 domain-containing protein [Mesorhizobium sp. LSHC420B00]ESX59555.1 hypothetical protein X759_36360 [Mesorhizobium sp. LSHC420B00]